MKKLSDERQLFDQIMTMLSHQFGPTCEVVLHDLTKPYDSTIIDIRNNHSGRKVGDSGSNLGLEVLKGTRGAGDRYNYVTMTKDQKVYRSSSIYIRDDEGKVIGALCVNLDITDSLRMENLLKQYNGYSPDQKKDGEEEESEEYFANNVQDLLQHLVQQAQQKIGKPVAIMDKSEKILFLRWLDDRGAFLISKSSEYVCELLGISKYTFYKYLEIAHEQDKRNGNT